MYKRQEVLYLAGEELDDLGGTLMRLDLADLSETALADNALHACAVTGDTVYYVSALAPTALMRLEIDTSGATVQATATQVATASGNIVDLSLLPEGVVATLEADQGALLYNHLAGAFAEYTGEVPAAALYTDDAFVRLSGCLLYTSRGGRHAEGIQLPHRVEYGVDEHAPIAKDAPHAPARRLRLSEACLLYTSRCV